MRTGVVWAAVSGTIACSCLFLGSPALAQATQLDVPAEDAGKSIPELARQAGIQVVAPGAELHGFVTPAIKGTYDAVAALKLMLKGTGLEVSRSPDGIITISQREKEDQEERQGMSYQPKASVSILALLFGTLTGGAYAQADQQMETVVVTGVRASLQSAQALKKDSAQIEDSIVAEDIGKLPDNNVIEALQHVTGVQVSRNAAEANQLLIRGLPDVATLLNGREIFTSTGRYVSLQDIPAELLQRVDVHKSAQSTDLEGGIAGLIDVRLHRPFDFDGLQIAGSARAIDSSLSGHVDPSASLLISDRWNTGIGEIGLLFDVNYSKRHYKEEILDNYISSQSICCVTGAVEPTGSTLPAGTAFIPLTEGGQSITGRRERAATDLSLQWRPNSNTEVYAELFYTRYRNPNSADFFVGLPWIGADASTATVSPGTNEVKTVNGGWYDLTSNQSFRAKTDTYQLATGATWTGDAMTLSTELDYTDSRFAQTGYILDTHYNPGAPPSYEADFNYQGTGTPYMNVPLASVTDPTNMVFRQWYDQWTKQTGNEIDWRADLTYDLGAGSFIKSIDAGVRIANRFAKNRGDNTGGLDCDETMPAAGSAAAAGEGAFYALDTAKAHSTACYGYGNSNPSGPNDSGEVTLASLPGSYHVTGGSIFDGKFGITKWMNADPEYLFNHVGEIRALFGQATTPPPADPTNSFDDREVSYAGYVKANFAFDGIVPIDGNIGLRVVDTESSMKGFVLQINTDNTYTIVAQNKDKGTVDWMPSINLRAKLQDDLFVRLAASRTVTRPTFAQLNPGLALSNSTATLLGSGTQGNPNLTPEKSANVDLSLEYYFGPANILSGTVFYRAVDGYIGSYVTPETIGGIVYQVTLPENGGSGHIDGAEINYTQFFDFLPGYFSGLGIQLNGTYVDGAFQNISKYSFNTVGIYEYGPVSFRVAYNWRAGFNEGAAPGGGQNPSTIYAKSQPWLDLSASYKWSDQLTFTFDATNLLNSYFQDSFGKGSEGAVYPRDTRRFDQTIELGLRYKL